MLYPILAFAIIAYGCHDAQAVPLGGIVTCSSSIFAIPCSTTTAKVGPGDEFYFTFFGSNSYAVDFGKGGFTLSALSGTFRNNGTNRFQDLTHEITGYTIKSIDNISNFDASNITLKNGVLSVDLNSNVLSSQGLNVALSLSLSQVPLSGSAPLFGAALVTFGATGYGLKCKQAAQA